MKSSRSSFVRCCHHRWLLGTGLVLVVLLLALTGASFYMLSYSLSPNPQRATENERMLREAEETYPEIVPWIDSLKQAKALRDTFVVMPTGERHHAFFVYGPHPTVRTAVLVHGYHDCAMRMIQLGYVYHHLLGYNILLPDLHAHGQSEGDAVQMGWKDRLDILRWTAIADSLFGAYNQWKISDSVVLARRTMHPETSSTRMVVHGVSMGAATTMSLSGEATPSYIRGFVEDCGYTSVWDEFSYELKEQFSLPSFPLMWSTSMLCDLRYGWSFGEASPLRQVAKCRKPMLFIHGMDDHYVPTRMVYPLYEAKRGEKMLYLAPGSQHAVSYRDHRKEYVAYVRAFCKKYVE